MKTEKEYYYELDMPRLQDIDAFGQQDDGLGLHATHFTAVELLEFAKSYANYVALFRVGELLDEQTNQIMSSQIRIFDNVPYRRCDEVDELITKHRPAQPSDTKHAQVESTEGRPHKLVEVPPEHGNLDFGKECNCVDGKVIVNEPAGTNGARSKYTYPCPKCTTPNQQQD